MRARREVGGSVWLTDLLAIFHLPPTAILMAQTKVYSSVAAGLGVESNCSQTGFGSCMRRLLSLPRRNSAAIQDTRILKAAKMKDGNQVRIALLTLALSAAPITLHAQATGTIMGTVTAAESGAPLSGAQIMVMGTVRRTVTNPQGTYRLTLEAGVYTVQATILGRQTVTRQASNTNGGMSTMNFALVSAEVAPEGVVTNAVRSPSKDTIKAKPTTPSAKRKPKTKTKTIEK